MRGNGFARRTTESIVTHTTDRLSVPARAVMEEALNAFFGVQDDGSTCSDAWSASGDDDDDDDLGALSFHPFARHFEDDFDPEVNLGPGSDPDLPDIDTDAT